MPLLIDFGVKIPLFLCNLYSVHKKFRNYRKVTFYPLPAGNVFVYALRCKALKYEVNKILTH